MCGSSHGIWSAIDNSKHDQAIQLPRSKNPTSSDRLISSRVSVRQSINELISGYIELVENRIQRGWSCHLLTVLFNQMPGNRNVVLRSMKDEIGWIYRTVVTRINRNPKRASTDELPILVGAADLPVLKSIRTSAPIIRCNDGLHIHLVLLVPPTSRLKGPVHDHFEQYADLYRGRRNLIQRIHVQSILQTPGQVVDYVLKTIKNRRLSYDDAIIVYPKAKREFV